MFNDVYPLHSLKLVILTQSFCKRIFKSSIRNTFILLANVLLSV
jgi:hypothetical protein